MGITATVFSERRLTDTGQDPIMSLAIWDGGRIIQSRSWNGDAPFGTSSYEQAFNTMSMSFDGNLACVTSGSSTTILSQAGDFAILPVGYRNMMGLTQGAVFAYDGYLYSPNYDVRFRPGSLAQESTGIDVGGAWYIAYDAANNCIWACYQGDDKLRRISLATGQDEPLGFVLPDTGMSNELLSVACSPSGEYLYVRSFGVVSGAQVVRGTVFSLFNGAIAAKVAIDPQYQQTPLPHDSAFGLDSLVTLSVPYSYGDARFVTTNYLSSGTTSTTYLDTGSVSPGDIVAPASGGAVYPHLLDDANLILAVPSREIYNALGSNSFLRGIDVRNGQFVAAPACLTSGPIYPEATQSSFWHGVGQPRVLERSGAGLLWTNLRYTAEVA